MGLSLAQYALTVQNCGIKHHSTIHSFIHSIVRSFILSFIHSFFHRFIHWFIHSFICSFFDWLIDSFIHSFFRSFILSLIHSFIDWLIHSFIISGLIIRRNHSTDHYSIGSSVSPNWISIIQLSLRDCYVAVPPFIYTVWNQWGAGRIKEVYTALSANQCLRYISNHTERPEDNVQEKRGNRKFEVLMYSITMDKQNSTVIVVGSKGAASALLEDTDS